MRLFVAAELSEELLEALAQTSALLRESVHGRYVAPDSFHVTLAFLGEVPELQVDAACEALEQACAGVPAIPVTLAPLGSFGRAKRATLWQGFSRGVSGKGPGRFRFGEVSSEQVPQPEGVADIVVPRRRFAVVVQLLSVRHNRRVRATCWRRSVISTAAARR
jgi:hypothetical protein